MNPGHVQRHWFVYAIVGVVAAALAAGRPLSALFVGSGTDPNRIYAVAKHIAVLLIFFLAGLNLRTETLSSQLRPLWLHAVAQGQVYVLFPLVVLVPWLVVSHLFGLPDELTVGIMALVVLPTTISSCIAFTANSGGNTALAVVNSAAANLFGVIASPLLLTLLLGGARGGFGVSGSELVDTLLDLARTVVVPIAIGQIVRLFLRARAGRRGVPLRLPPTRTISNVGILAIIAATMLQATGDPSFFSRFAAQWPAVVYVAVMHFALVALTRGGLDRLPTSNRNRTALYYVGTQKTLAFGAPMLSTYFAGRPDVLAVAMVPLIAYHLLQLVVAGLLQSFYTERNRTEAPE